jgi:hypothetical protein
MVCPEKTNNASTTACSNCKLVDGEKPHPSNYPGFGDAKEEICRRKAQRTQKNTKGRMFSSKYTTPVLSFAAALRNNTEQQQQPHVQPQWKNRVSLLLCGSKMQVSQSRLQI